MPTINVATVADLRFILQQQAAESNALGFVPKRRMELELHRGRILLATAGRERLGYCYVGSTRSGILPIYQCVTEAGVRRRAIGEAFTTHVVNLAKAGNCRLVQCHCRDDLEANAFWQAMHFELVRQRPAGAGRGRILNTYNLPLDYTDYVDYNASDGNDAVHDQELCMKAKKPTSVRLDRSSRDILKSLQKEWQCAQSDVLTTLLKEAGVAQMRRAAKPPADGKPQEWRKALKEINAKATTSAVKAGK